MTIWIVLFILILSVSFILALFSMREFPKNPQSYCQYGLFLIKKTALLSSFYLDLLHQKLNQPGLIIAFERLIKGDKSALVLYGPKDLLKSGGSLDLLELEDYTQNVKEDDFVAWELAAKDTRGDIKLISPFKNFPKIEEEEQFWWQVVLVPKRGSPLYQFEVRAVFLSAKNQRLMELQDRLKRLNGVTIMPKPYSKEQILNFYQDRVYLKHQQNPILPSIEVLKLIKLF